MGSYLRFLVLKSLGVPERGWLHHGARLSHRAVFVSQVGRAVSP